MALDHALATCLEPTSGVLRLYGWDRPTVSFGRNEPALGRYSAQAAARAGLSLVRRPTGGRAVVHRRELTYSVVAPIRALGGPRCAFRSINEALARALRSLGAMVELEGLSGADATPGPSAGPCFRSPAPGEITSGGRKLVGSAQVRVGDVLLQHGSILLEDDQAMIEALTVGTGGGGGETGGRRGGDDRRPASLGELVDNVSIDELAESVAESLRTKLGGRWTAGGYHAVEIEAASRLESERYARDSWTWRR